MKKSEIKVKQYENASEENLLVFARLSTSKKQAVCKASFFLFRIAFKTTCRFCSESREIGFDKWQI